MLKAKIGLALLALSASVCGAATDGDAERYKRHRSRHLRRGMFTGKKYRLDNDLTEDVAFWTRKLQFSLPPAPTPDVQSLIPTSSGLETAPPVVAIAPTVPPVTTPGDVPTYPPTPSTMPPVGTPPPIGSAPPVAVDPTDPPVAGPGGMPTYPPTPSTTSATQPPVGTTPPIGSAPPVAVDPTDPPVAGPGGMPTYPPTLSTTLETEPPVGVPETDPPVGTTPSTDPPVSAPSGGGAVAVDDTITISSSDGIAFIPVIENDTPAAGQSLSVKRADGASNGNCSIGLDLLEVVYQPDAGFVGVDVCEYEACDDQEPPQCVLATVTITVT